MTTILVTGATGRVGRHVVDGLRAAGVTVRALVRTPDLAGLPPDVELIKGDIYDPTAVRRAAADVDAAFLLWPSFSADGAADVVAELPRRVVYLSALSASSGGVWADVEELLRDVGKEWTFVRPGGFAVNAQGWATEFRTGDVVRVASPEAGRSLIHERDIAAVAVLALLNDQHIGQVYDLTGPAVLTQAEQIRTIARAIGNEMRVEALSDAEARQAMLDLGADPILAESSVAYWASLVDNPEPVTTTVTELTGRPALTFAEWADEHAAEFRVLSAAEVADRYVDALSTGRLDQALALTAPEVVRVAPLETGGEEIEVKGADAILENARRLSADIEYLGVDIVGPLLLDNHFAVRFTFDQLDVRTGTRSHTTKLSLCTVESGQVTREEVFYYTPPKP
ncbi:NAD(P)H-binding protein [Kribbella soli]|uniref:NAD-dependent epimerase/dehydratase family protein n=1 Tax=Kribbella soli TaxID=1124743 RepID=A0A4V2M068_9ACTN|nr:NAD(P)H-binding protein [Kribbella soli]TCC10936.1 NAD-dependent epimerase/dehydratase family protein [Kribbella soli]